MYFISDNDVGYISMSSYVSSNFSSSFALHLPELKVFSQFQKLCQLMKINVVCCSQCCIPILEVLALGELEQVKRLIKNYF